MQIIFDDNGKHLALAPLSLTRPVAELRLGILTIRESWELHLKADPIHSCFITENYLQEKYTAPVNQGLRIAGNIKPSAELSSMVEELSEGQSLYINGIWIASKGAGQVRVEIEVEKLPFVEINALWDLFQNNGAAILFDFDLLTKDKTTQQLSATNTVLGEHDIFVEEGAKVECAILNATNGPIYIGEHSEVMEGAIIKGPFALCEHAVIKMGAKMYGDSTIGPYCKVGGGSFKLNFPSLF